MRGRPGEPGSGAASIGSSEPLDAPPRANKQTRPVGRVLLWAGAAEGCTRQWQRMKLSRLDDPIVAVATAPGRGAVGIVRVSGRSLAPLIAAVCGRALEPRHATLCAFAGDDGRALDHGIALHYPAPQSYTGEDVLELQAHGGAVVLQLLIARCLEIAREADPSSPLHALRLAEPGE